MLRAGLLFCGNDRRRQVNAHEQAGRMIRLELKYCERCGGLLLRGSGDTVVYCRACAEALRKERMEEIRLERELSGKRQYRQRTTATAEPAAARQGEARELPPKKPVQAVRIEAAEQRRQG